MRTKNFVKKYKKRAFGVSFILLFAGFSSCTNDNSAETKQNTDDKTKGADPIEIWTKMRESIAADTATALYSDTVVDLNPDTALANEMGSSVR